MAWLQKTWYRFVRPSENITDPLERQRVIILASILLLSMLSSVFSFIILPILIGWQINHIYSIIGILSYIPLLKLARSRYYRLAAWLFLLISSSLVIIGVSLNEHETAALNLNFFMVFILIAGLILSPPEIGIFVALGLIAELLIAYYKGTPTYIVFNTTSLTIAGALSVIAFSTITNIFKRRALESEARYRELMNAQSEGILVIAENDARILDANPAVEKILGYQLAEIIGRFPIEFLASASKDIVRQIWIRRDKGIPIEAEALHKDGSTVYIEATLKPFNYMQKNAFVLTLMDISERKQVEALVIESEKRFRAIFNETSHFIGVLDVRGKIIELNEQGFDFFGLRSENAIGRYLWDIRQWAHNDRAKERIQEVVERVAAGEIMRYDVEVRNRHNQPAFLDFTLKPVLDLDGTVSMLIADSRDITAYKLAEQKRVEYERRYDALFETTADAIFVFSLDSRFITMNKRASDMLGYSPSELEGKSTSLAIIPEEVSASRNVLERLVGGEELDIYERKLRRKNGEVFSVEISVMLVRDADNRPMYFQSLVRDISERKRMERQQLEMAIEKERAKLLQAFIEQASHHFRTPITNLKTSLYLLPRFLNNDEKREQHMQVINQELLRLQALLDDLLTVLRLQKSNTEYSLSKIQMRQFMSELRSNQEGRDYYPRFQWDWQIMEEDVIVIGDKAVLGRAVLNLLENATTYTRDAGKITVRCIQKDAWLSLEIIDTGIGIRADDLPHIFDDFYRTQDALATRVSSSGLGLTISKSIVERHQGTIRVESRFGEGSRFQILLPIYTEWTSTPPPLPEFI